MSDTAAEPVVRTIVRWQHHPDPWGTVNVVRVTTTVELLAGPFKTSGQAEKWMVEHGETTV